MWLGSSLPQAMGIFAVALSGPSGSALPTLRSTMKQPLHFKRVLLIALGVMTGVYALMGAIGYFYFGSEASQLITADLEAKSVLSHMRIFGAIRVRVFDVLPGIAPLLSTAITPGTALSLCISYWCHASCAKATCCAMPFVLLFTQSCPNDCFTCKALQSTPIKLYPCQAVQMGETHNYQR